MMNITGIRKKIQPYYEKLLEDKKNNTSAEDIKYTIIKQNFLKVNGCSSLSLLQIFSFKSDFS